MLAPADDDGDDGAFSLKINYDKKPILITQIF